MDTIRTLRSRALADVDAATVALVALDWATTPEPQRQAAKLRTRAAIAALLALIDPGLPGAP